MVYSFSTWLRQNLWWIAPASMTAIAWGAAVLGTFQYDDFANIINDPATHHAHALVDRLATGIRPLTRLSYAFTAWVFGAWAGGWLLINLLLHLFTAIGIAKLVHWRTLNVNAAALSGACFALQPANAAVVAYVSGRSTGLAVAALVAAMLMHERGIRSKSKHASGWGVLLFLCACACKEIALVFPALMLLWERTRHEPADWDSALKRIAPYAIAAVIAAMVMLLFSPRYRELLAFSLSFRAPLDALLHNLVALPMSLALWFTPWSLSVEHDLPFSTPALLLGATCIAVAISIAVREHTRRSFIAVALLWPMIAMLPTHSFIAKADAITEGPLYLAWIGPSIALGEWFAQRVIVRGHVYVRVFAVAMCALAILLCEWRVSVWSSPVALWEEATLRTPQSARAWTNLGVAQLAAGENDSARNSLKTALQFEPNNMQARFNLDIVAALSAPAE